MMETEDGKYMLTARGIREVERLGQVLEPKQVAFVLGIHRATFEAIRKRQPEVDDAFEAGKAKSIGKVATCLLAAALDGDREAQKFYLRCQAGWVEKKHVEMTTTGVEDALSKLAAVAASESI